MIKRTESGRLYARGYANLKLPKNFGAVPPLQEEKANKHTNQNQKNQARPIKQKKNLKPQESPKYSFPCTPCWNFALLNSELGLAGWLLMHAS